MIKTEREKKGTTGKGIRRNERSRRKRQLYGGQAKLTVGEYRGRRIVKEEKEEWYSEMY